MELQNETSSPKESNRISIDDVKRWGLHTITSGDHTSAPHGCYIVRLPENAEITDKEGNVVARASKEKPIGFVERETGRVGVEKENAFFVDKVDHVPTLSQINEWNNREKRLTEQENAWLNFYIAKHEQGTRREDEDRVFFTDRGPVRRSRKTEFTADLIKERRENLRNGIIKDAELLSRVLDERTHEHGSKNLYSMMFMERKKRLQK